MLTPGLSQHCASLQRRSLCPIAPLRRPHCSGDGEPLGAAVPPPRPQPRDGPVGGERRGTEGHGLRLREDQDRSSAAVGRRQRGGRGGSPGPDRRPLCPPRRGTAAPTSGASAALQRCPPAGHCAGAVCPPSHAHTLLRATPGESHGDRGGGGGNRASAEADPPAVCPGLREGWEEGERFPPRC